MLLLDWQNSTRFLDYFTNLAFCIKLHFLRRGQMQPGELWQGNWLKFDEELMLQSMHPLKRSSVNLSLHFWCKLWPVTLLKFTVLALVLHSDCTFGDDLFWRKVSELCHKNGLLWKLRCCIYCVKVHHHIESTFVFPVTRDNWASSFGDVWWSFPDVYFEILDVDSTICWNLAQCPFIRRPLYSFTLLFLLFLHHPENLT